MINCPCVGCKKRVQGCHSSCDAYAGYRKEVDEMRLAMKHSHIGREHYPYDKYFHGDRCRGRSGRDDSNR